MSKKTLSTGKEKTSIKITRENTNFNHLFILQTDKNGHPDEVKLDAEMEKVFAGKDRDREKFDVDQFRDDDNTRKTSKFSDQAYDCKYRTKSIHYLQLPIFVYITDTLKRNIHSPTTLHY